MVKKGKDKHIVTWAQCFRDIVVHSINKGVLLPIGVFLFVIIPVMKLTPKDSSKFINDIMEALIDGYLLGWILFIITLITWGIFAKKTRQSYSKYMDIAGNEKTKAQQRLNISTKLGTSNRR